MQLKSGLCQYAWSRQGIENVAGHSFAQQLESLRLLVKTLEDMLAAGPNLTESLGQVNELLLMYGRASDIVWTLSTACRAHQSQNSTDTFATKQNALVMALAMRLKTVLSQLEHALAQVDAAQVTQDFPEVQVWLNRLREHQTLTGSTVNLDTVKTRVILPLMTLHNHLCNSLRIDVEDGNKMRRAFSFSQAIGVLKSSDDAVLRRQTFNTMSAWFAQQAPMFADLLNAVTGYHVCRLARDGGDIYRFALRQEKLSVAAFQAMREALFERLPQLQAIVRDRAAGFGGERLHVSNLLAAEPGYRSFISEHCQGVETIAKGYSKIDSGFGVFLDEAVQKQWIDAQKVSSKAGGTWCDNLPSLKAVAIFSNAITNDVSAYQFSHLLGVGYCHRVLHSASSAARVIPLSILEIGGKLSETALEHQLLETALGTDQEHSVRRQIQQRVINMTLSLMVRHQLMADVLEKRKTGPLSVQDFNALSQTAWKQYFGDTLSCPDQYIWAYKHHFYRTDVLFYDWQYVFGFLVAHVLYQHLKTQAVEGAIQRFFSDAAVMDCESLLSRHLGEDIRSRAFWLRAIDETISPVG